MSKREEHTDPENVVPENALPEDTVPENTVPGRTSDGHLQYLITAYLFENISEAGRHEVESHLVQCAECRVELEELRATLLQVEDAIAPGAPDEPGAPVYSFEARRLERVLAAAKALGSRSWISRWRMPLGLAAAAVICVGILLAPSLLKTRGRKEFLNYQAATSSLTASGSSIIGGSTERGYDPTELAAHSAAGDAVEGEASKQLGTEKLPDRADLPPQQAAKSEGARSAGRQMFAAGAKAGAPAGGAVPPAVPQTLSATDQVEGLVADLESKTKNENAGGESAARPGEQLAQRVEAERSRSLGFVKQGSPQKLNKEKAPALQPASLFAVAPEPLAVQSGDAIKLVGSNLDAIVKPGSDGAAPAAQPHESFGGREVAAASLGQTPAEVGRRAGLQPATRGKVPIKNLISVEAGAPAAAAQAPTPAQGQVTAGVEVAAKERFFRGDGQINQPEEGKKVGEIAQAGAPKAQTAADVAADSWARLKERQPRDGLQMGGVVRNQGVADAGVFKWNTNSTAIGEGGAGEGAATPPTQGANREEERRALRREGRATTPESSEPALEKAEEMRESKMALKDVQRPVLGEQEADRKPAPAQQAAQNRSAAGMPPTTKADDAKSESQLAERDKGTLGVLLKDAPAWDTITQNANKDAKLRTADFGPPDTPGQLAYQPPANGPEGRGTTAGGQAGGGNLITLAPGAGGGGGGASIGDKNDAYAMGWRFGIDKGKPESQEGLPRLQQSPEIDASQSDAPEMAQFYGISTDDVSSEKPGAMVTLESRFLDTQDHFLEEVGVNLGNRDASFLPNSIPDIQSDAATRTLIESSAGQTGIDVDAKKRVAVRISSALELGLRGYHHYRSLDQGLTPQVFFSHPVHVPAPTVGDEGLGEAGFRARYGVNPFVDTQRDHLSTFGMDVDTASYTLARGALQSGKLPDPKTVRVEECVNYFREDVPADPSAVFSVRCEGGPSPFGEGLDLLKVTVKARDLLPGERKDAVLTFAVDTSGSMNLDDRLGLVRAALETLVGSLKPDDRVGIVAFGANPYLVIPHTPARERERILDAVRSLAPGGGTNVEAGLDLAYRVADEVLEQKAVNRVILCSDGVANVGARGPEAILKKAEVFAQRGIYLSCIGVGRGKYNDAMLETLSKKGNGNYAYVDSPAAASEIFQKNLPSTLQVLAQDAKIQVDFNADVVSHYRLLGYEKRDIADTDFRNDKVDAGEVGPGSTVTVLYEIRRRANASGDLGRIYLRYRDAGTRRVDEVNYPLPPGVLAVSLGETSDRFRFIASVAETAELLRGSYWARNGSYGRVLSVLKSVSPAYRARPEWQEVVDLASRAQALTIQDLSSK